MSNDTLGAYNIFDLREMAKARLPKWLFEFVDRGTEDEVILRHNREIFDNIRLVPRMLRDVSKRNPKTTIFGKEISMPVAIAPTGAAGMMWYQGELELAKAARDAPVLARMAVLSAQYLRYGYCCPYRTISSLTYGYGFYKICVYE